jgi:hypothetical protein
VIEFISSPPAASKLTPSTEAAAVDTAKPAKKPSRMRKLGAKKKLKSNNADAEGGESDDSDDRISTALLSKNALEASKPFAQKKPPKVPAGGKRSMLVIPDDDAERAGRLSLGTGKPSSPPPSHQNSSSVTATTAVSTKKAAMSARKSAVSTTAVVVATNSSMAQPLAPPPITINIGAGSMPAFKLPGGIPAFKMPSKAPIVSAPVASTTNQQQHAGRLDLDMQTGSAPMPGALLSRPLFKMPKLK